jgi:probable HAF family extracellular repeat protein
MSIRSPYNPTSNKAMAFRWTKEEGEQLLGSLHDAFIESKATHISADGLVIIGYSMENNLQSRAFRWTRAGGRHFLIRLTSYHDHLPSGINADGSIIAGSCNHQQRDFIAFLWSLGNGTESVKALLEARGIPLFGCTLEKVQSITPDGTVVVGSGKRQHDPNSPLQAWRAVIPKKNLF